MICFSSLIPQQYTGFLSVYAIVGFLLLCCVGLNHFFVPGHVPFGVKKDSEVELGRNDSIDFDTKSSTPSKMKWFHLFLIPTILVIILNLFTTAVSIGFLYATLESHLEQFHLSTFQTSAVFTVSNAIYTITTPVWGKISDRLKKSWRFAVIFGGTGLILAGFSWLGPLPFFNVNS